MVSLRPIRLISIIEISLLSSSFFHSLGQQIVKAAFAQGVRVTSISRTGAPPALDPSLEGVDGAAVRWKRADIFNESQWVGELTEADAVISCLGAFGSNQVTNVTYCRGT